ncbi:MAG: hypothetical protein ACKVVT_08830 [Dehalococcoidia bacterium]
MESMRILNLAAIVTAVGVSVGLVVAAGGLGFVAFGGATSGSASYSDWPTFRTIEPLVSASVVVVRGRMISDRDWELSLPAPGDENTVSASRVRVSEFEILEVFRGDIRAGDRIAVGTGLDYSPGSAFAGIGPILLMRGGEYVLFLTRTAVGGEYPSWYPRVLYVSPGDPSVAVLDGDTLRFLVREGPTTELAPRFTATLAQVRELGAALRMRTQPADTGRPEATAEPVKPGRQ